VQLLLPSHGSGAGTAVVMQTRTRRSKPPRRLSLLRPCPGCWEVRYALFDHAEDSATVATSVRLRVSSNVKG